MEKIHEQIKIKLNELRVHLQSDGGDLEIVELKDKTVKLRLKGACDACPHAMTTIKSGLEHILREEIDPEITVERVI